MLLAIPLVTADNHDNDIPRYYNDSVILKPQQNLTNEEIDYYYSRISVEDNKLIINYSETGEEITYRSRWFRVGNWSFAVEEIDAYLGQIITVYDYETVSFELFPNPNLPLRDDERFHIGINGSIEWLQIGNGRMLTNLNRFHRFESDSLREDYFTLFYEFDRIPYNIEIIAKFVEHPKPFAWWLGEGQGGIGNGIDTCDFIFTDISLNQTQTYIGSTFTMGNKWEAEAGAGCSITSIAWQNYNNLGLWRSIPSTNQSETNLNCNGTICSQNSPTKSVWYYRTIQCDGIGNRSIRTLPTGTAPSLLPSTTRNMECLPLESENLTTNNNVQIEDSYDDTRINWTIPAIFGLILIIFVILGGFDQ